MSSATGLVQRSVQLAFARQDAKEQGRAMMIGAGRMTATARADIQDHQVRPRRLTDAARLSLVLWSRLFDWKEALMVLTPGTFIRWHRKAFKLYWLWKSRGGRPPLPKDIAGTDASSIRIGMRELRLAKTARGRLTSNRCFAIYTCRLRSGLGLLDECRNAQAKKI